MTDEMTGGSKVSVCRLSAILGFFGGINPPWLCVSHKKHVLFFNFFLDHVSDGYHSGKFCLWMVTDARKFTELSTKRDPFIVRSAFSFFSVFTFARTIHELKKRCFFVLGVLKNVLCFGFVFFWFWRFCFFGVLPSERPRHESIYSSVRISEFGYYSWCWVERSDNLSRMTDWIADHFNEWYLSDI